jgi:hypothetical protein
MSGKVFISMADKYKADAVGIAKQLTDLGYGVVSTRGTAATLMAAGKCGCGLTAVATMLLQEPVGCGMSAQSNPHPVAAGSPSCQAAAPLFPPALRPHCALVPGDTL